MPLPRRRPCPVLARLGVALAVAVAGMAAGPALAQTPSAPLVAETGSIVMDVGTSRTFEASPTATAVRWILDGDEVGTGPTFAWTPDRKATGVHWLRALETDALGNRGTRQWVVRARIPLPAPTVAFHVSPTGSDSANGSAAAPFRTLEKAREAVRALPRPLPAGGVAVLLRGGVHRRTTTLVLGSSDSGTPEAPITWGAFPGETPILTGARAIPSASIAPLAASEHARVAPGIDPAHLWEVSVAGVTRAAPFPNLFNEWWIFNALRSSQNGGFLEVFLDGSRLRLSRYPNADPNDDSLTPNLLMNGVAQGTATDGSGYLNAGGTYVDSDGVSHAVGGAFHLNPADVPRVARWKTALSRGGVWLMGYWRVPWQINGLRVGVIDTGSKQAIGLAQGVTPNLGIGNKYTRPAGNRKEPWFAVNLLEELDQVGEWCIDFSRQRLVVYTGSATPPADGALELSDLSGPLVQLNGASDVLVRGLTFRRQLGHAVQVVGGARNLVAGCTFLQAGNVAVDLNGGTSHGVVSCDFEDLAAGGVLVRGGTVAAPRVPTGHFVVNNRFRRFGQVVRVYQGAIDTGFGGPMGTWQGTSVGTRVASNDLSGTPHGGIYWASYDHVIEYNAVSDFVRISEDMGGIYHYGPNYEAGTVIRYNHLHDSPLGEGIYNDADHVRTRVHGNVVNLRTRTTAGRGYGYWTNTNTTAGAAVPGLSTALVLHDNIGVNGRGNFFLHSSLGGRIEHNLSYRSLGAPFNWRRITTNTSTNTQSIATSTAEVLGSGPNPAYTVDPGFVDFDAGDLRLRPDAQAWRDVPGLQPFALELAGLHVDEHRAAAPTWTPFVVTGAASAVGTTTAVFNGALVYPQFDRSAEVFVHWGPADGGTSAAAWASVASLGKPGSGPLARQVSGLAPGQRVWFRFRAANDAGEHWAEASNSTTTFTDGVEPDVVAPVLGIPGDLEVPATSGAGAVVAFTVTAVDALAGTVVPVVEPPSGSLFPVGSTTVRVSATDPSGNRSTASFVVRVSLPPVPSPWVVRQVGSSTGGLPGSALYFPETGRFQVTGGGGDIWSGTNESFTFIHRPWVGDGTFTARLASFASQDGSAKAGIMVRETLSVGARSSFVYLSRSGTAFFQNKTSPSGNVSPASITNRGVPEWIRLVRAGNRFTAFVSGDGTTWTQVGTAVTNTLADAALQVGLAVGPRTVGTTSAVEFDSVTMHAPLDLWRLARLGTADATGTAADAADPDADGIPNLLEYALGLSPLERQQAQALGVDLLDVTVHVRFPRLADPALRYLLEGADDARGPWELLGSSTGAANAEGAASVPDTVTPDLADRRFYRLTVSAP